LEFGVSITKIGAKSLDMKTGIFYKNEEEPIAVATVLMVCFDYVTQKTIKVPQVFVDFADENARD
jgi:acyl-CoA thioesterase FadM